MDKAGKAVALEAYKEVFADAGVIVVTQYSGLTVTQLTDLRVKLKAEGANLKVIKNRLAKIALDGRGGDAAGAMFVGPVAIAFSPDPVAASKVVAEFAKGNEKLVLVGALMGDMVLDQNAVKQLASLPSLDQLRGKIIGLIQAPATKIAGVVAAPAAQLVSLALTPTRTPPETCCNTRHP
jgi:large subunit ribosomal protein L10